MTESKRPPGGAPSGGEELRRQLLGLMLGRSAALTLLLGCGILVERMLTPATVRVTHFYAVTGAGYALSILYALVHRWWASSPPWAYAQLFADLLLVTGLVYATGGVDSPFSALYFMVIIAASVIKRRRGAFVTAVSAWLLYGLLVVLIVYRVLPIGPGGRAGDLLSDVSAIRQISYSLFAHFLGFFAVAFLSSTLAEKLHRTGRELIEKTEDLARLQALSKNIVDSITGGVITTDLTGTITFVNRGGEEIFGRPAAEIVDRPVWEVLGQPRELLAAVSDELGRERRKRLETNVPGPRGTPIVLGTASSILKDPRGAPTGFIFTFQDLTDIKALEEEVRVKDRMAVLGSVAAGMAHEVRNPLASMSGSVQLLKKSLRPEGQDAELFDIVVREGRRLDRIIQDFLTFARPGRFSPEPADLVPILCESLLLIRNGEEFRGGHRIETDLPEEGIFARADVNMIRQVFWNLAKNALKAMPEGGSLKVTASYGPEGKVVVAFTDEGVGMTREEAEASFQPFRGSFSGGAGLGLAIVFRIVQEHGGRIRVKSRPGAGTTFTLELPAAEGGPDRLPGARAAAASRT